MIYSLLEKDVIPEVLIRFGVRQITKRRIHKVKKMDVAQKEDYLMDFIHRRSRLRTRAV